MLAVAALDVLILADNHNAGFGRAVTRGEQMCLLVIAPLPSTQVIGYVRYPSRTATDERGNRPNNDRCAGREKAPLGRSMSSEIMHQILRTIEEEMTSRPSAIEFEMAYQVRVAVDRIRFAITHVEKFGKSCDQMREAGLQLLDALDRVDAVDRRFKARSRFSRPNENGASASKAAV